MNFCNIFVVLAKTFLESYTLPKVIDFPRYSGENEIPHGLFRVVSRFPQHFVLYLGNLDSLLDSVRMFLVANIFPLFSCLRCDTLFPCHQEFRGPASSHSGRRIAVVFANLNNCGTLNNQHPKSKFIFVETAAQPLLEQSDI